MGKLAILWKNNKLLLSAFVAAVAVMVFFAVRLTFFVIYWNDPAHRDQALEPWMSLGYVSHSWHVPREALIERLGVRTGEGFGPRPLEEIAKEQGVPYDEFAKRVDEAVQQLLKEKPAQ